MLLALLLAVASTPLAPAEGFVLDEAGVLARGEIDSLNRRIKAISDSGAGQIGVLLTNDLRGKTRNELAPEVFRAWGIGYGDRGPTGRGRGVLILVKVAQPDRGVRIEVGRDLEGRLNDGKTGEIVRSAIPSFREGRWVDGLSGLIDLLGAEMAAEAVAVAAPVRPAVGPSPTDAVWEVLPIPLLVGWVMEGLSQLLLLVGVFLFFRWFRRRTARRSIDGESPPQLPIFAGGHHRDNDESWTSSSSSSWDSGSSSSHSSSSNSSSSSPSSSGNDSGRFGGGGDSGGGGADSSF